MKRSWIAALVIGCLALAALGAGCGGDDDETTSGSAETTSAEAGSTEAEGGGGSALVGEEVEKYIAGGFRPLPTSSPKPEPGKSVWLISLSQAASGNALPIEAAAEAAEKIGWTTKIYDGKGDYGRISAGIDAAVASGADGLIIGATDCGQVKAALERADDAGVKTYGMGALDCDDKYGGSGEPLFSGVLEFGPVGNYGQMFEQQIAPAAAFYAIQQQEEKGGPIIAITESDNAILSYSKDGTLKTFEEACTGDCSFEEYSITFQDVINGRVATKVSAALAQHPDANVVLFPYDAVITAGGLEAVQGSGRAGDMSLIGAVGAPENFDLIRNGKQSATVVISPVWNGWASIDGLNRVFHGEPQADPGLGAQLVTKEDNLPPAGQEYEAPVDFIANYEKIWGVK